jgi:hypothetical protein
MFSYRAYGLNLTSNCVIPGLCANPTSVCADVIITIGGATPPDWVSKAQHVSPSLTRSRSPQSDNPAWSVVSRSGGSTYELEFADSTQFVVARAGDRLWGKSPDWMTLEDFAVYVRGPALGLILQCRGITALHASSVVIAGHAVVMCGERESGKSTTAAALSRRGIAVLAEDISALAEQNDAIFVEPGYPRVCLWPDAVENLFGKPDAIPKLTPTWEKRFLPLDGTLAEFDPQRRALGTIYLLAPRDSTANSPRIEELRRRDALLALVQNTYMNKVLDREKRGAEFDMLSKIVTQIPVRKIVPHVDPARLGKLCDLIVDDAQSVIS